MKRIFFSLWCSVMLLCTGCEDSFVAAPHPTTGGKASRLIFTTVTSSGYVSPFTSISTTTYDGNDRYNIIADDSYLTCAPQAGKILYLEPRKQHGDDHIVLKVADMKHPDKAIVIDTFDNEGAPALREFALSPDGRFVAYAVLQFVDLYPINVIRWFDIEKKQRFDLDSFPAIGGGWEKRVSAFISQVSFSPTGQYLAVSTWGRMEKLHIYRVDQKGISSLGSRIGNMVGPYFTWVPETNTIIYTTRYSTGGTESPCMEALSSVYSYSIPDSSKITIYDLDGGARTSTEWQAPILELSCSPDGQKLLFVQLSRDAFQSECYFPMLALRDMSDMDGNTYRVIASGNNVIAPGSMPQYSNPQWTPDGLAVSFTHFTLLSTTPVFISSSIKRISSPGTTLESEIEIFNALNGYWLP